MGALNYSARIGQRPSGQSETQYCRKVNSTYLHHIRLLSSCESHRCIVTIARRQSGCKANHSSYKEYLDLQVAFLFTDELADTGFVPSPTAFLALFLKTVYPSMADLVLDVRALIHAFDLHKMVIVKVFAGQLVNLRSEVLHNNAVKGSKPQ